VSVPIATPVKKPWFHNLYAIIFIVIAIIVVLLLSLWFFISLTPSSNTATINATKVVGGKK
jgi:multidrug resistance efflux pump